MALQEMRRSKKNKRALLIISDGGDNNSRYTVREVNKLIQESDVLIYAIGVFGGGSTPEEAAGPETPVAHRGRNGRADVLRQPCGNAGRRQKDWN